MNTDTPVHTLPANLRGHELLDDPLYNKGTAFTEKERDKLGLRGLLPPHVDSIQEQLVRTYDAFQDMETDLHKHINLRQLQDTNEVLFYRLLSEHIEEMLPIVYTPTVGLGCQRFSHIYRRPRGLFIAYPNRDRIRQMLANRPHRDVDVIVVTDGERILGIGDQGVGGMGIPIGKLSLYTLIGGIHPSRTLPIIIDVGTNNQELLNDPMYMGWRHERITGDKYYSFIDRFVEAVKADLPSACLQWEDFATPHARPLLQKYRDKLLTFNDDIQGTAAVVLGAIIGAINVTGQSFKDQQIVFLGAGSAGIGVADYLRVALVERGLSEAEARARFFIIDRDGLLHSNRKDLVPEQVVYAQSWDKVSGWPKTMNGTIGLADVIGQTNATVLIGLSTVTGAFSESIVRAMAANVDRPIVFPLSNPTSNSEAKAEDLMRWTDGRALVASGSPFAPVECNGREIPIAQCNNVYIFPAIGLALSACQATRITDVMMIAAAQELGKNSPAIKDPNGSLLPALKDVREVAAKIAVAVGMQAVKDGVAPRACEDELRRRVARLQWKPEYPVY
ncbi:MAG: NAD-dependent malic enzyme [Syntrophales bacterium]|jgi:malate dehydrogenase (oxaloacetate-decarboxylating)|nr:NAD-dependent malic enzyme [Syntrophobacterales bacterium]